jgi:hypothetical protein
MLRCRIRCALAAERRFIGSRQGCACFKHGKIMAAIWQKILLKMV